MQETTIASDTVFDGKLLKRGSEPEELDKLVEVSELSHSWDLTVRDWLDAIDGTKPNEIVENARVFEVKLSEADLAYLELRSETR